MRWPAMSPSVCQKRLPQTLIYSADGNELSVDRNRSRGIASPVLFAQTAGAQTASDWPTYNRDLAATRYSALKQINTGNVSKLAQAWTYRLRPDANSPPAGTMNEVTPIVVNGVMYLPAGNRVVALDPETGAEIWRYDIENRRGLAARRLLLAGRQGKSPAHSLHHRPQDGGAERQDRQARSRLRQ